jgi:hypothetical protein
MYVISSQHCLKLSMKPAFANVVIQVFTSLSLRYCFLYLSNWRSPIARPNLCSTNLNISALMCNQYPIFSIYYYIYYIMGKLLFGLRIYDIIFACKQLQQ